ncbi:hypothetical protein BGZ63DRAFT_52822 [Mariannaea sp. PMI_226]|nr:hypothetical protein BGZ63DRAFT_52822 [Mariannaea sp. PMI_226]
MVLPARGSLSTMVSAACLSGIVMCQIKRLKRKRDCTRHLLSLTPPSSPKSHRAPLSNPPTNISTMVYHQNLPA